MGVAAARYFDCVGRVPVLRQGFHIPTVLEKLSCQRLGVGCEQQLGYLFLVHDCFARGRTFLSQNYAL